MQRKRLLCLVVINRNLFNIKGYMDRFLKKIPYSVLIFFSVIMLLTPFSPKPHSVEKIQMLINGTLHRPIDIFDLIFHFTPLILLVIKFVRMKVWNKT